MSDPDMDAGGWNNRAFDGHPDQSSATDVGPGTAAPRSELWTPDWDDQLKMGERYLLTMLDRWSDAEGRIHGTINEFAEKLRIGSSTAREYLSTLVRSGYVSRAPRERGPGGTLECYCHQLSLEKLGRACDGSKGSVLAESTLDAVSARVEKDKSPPPELGIHYRQNSATSAETQPLPPELSGGGECESITTHARASARVRALPFPFYSIFLSFPWRDDKTKLKAERVLSACREGLGDLDAQRGRVLNSLANVLDGMWDEFDFDLDVLPVVKIKTGPNRASPLMDFGLLKENLRKHRGRRLTSAKSHEQRWREASSPPAKRWSSNVERQRNVQEFVPPPMNSSDARTAKAAALRATIRMIGDGQRPLFLLPHSERNLPGSLLDAAFTRQLHQAQQELSQLEATCSDGASDTGETPT